MQNSNKQKLRVSIYLTKIINRVKDDSNIVLNTLYDSACRYACKKHPINKKYMDERDVIEVDELRESTLYVRFQQLKQHFSWAL